MFVHFSPSASSDLEEIGDYIHLENPAAAYRFVNDLRQRCGQLADNPKMGVARPELDETLRSLSFRRYIIFYTVAAETVRIERILHGARDIERLFRD